MKEKLTLLIALSITLIAIFLYGCIPVMTISSFTEQKFDNFGEDITETENITSEIQETLQTETEKIEVDTNKNLLQSTTESIDNTSAAVTVVEFPIAQYIWDRLIELGYSEYVAAGIIGNLVAEVGDPSTKDSNFDLDWESNTGIEIGLCQWTQGRRQTIINRYGNSPHYTNQIDYMIDELLGTNGIERQVSENQYQLIINASTPKEAAYYFALYFERCYRDETGRGKDSYNARQNKAQQAYEYFSSVN